MPPGGRPMPRPASPTPAPMVAVLGGCTFSALPTMVPMLLVASGMWTRTSPIARNGPSFGRSSAVHPTNERLCPPSWRDGTPSRSVRPRTTPPPERTGTRSSWPGTSAPRRPEQHCFLRPRRRGRCPTSCFWTRTCGRSLRVRRCRRCCPWRCTDGNCSRSRGKAAGMTARWPRPRPLAPSSSPSRSGRYLIWPADVRTGLARIWTPTSRSRRTSWRRGSATS
mmetsp:Transcript_11224/g.26398  ORF Transcript_11224/g.26398 Transcript_11224/m.26398 type:complete len:223 (+) Transcript_11224:47-715(+)